MTRYDSPGLDDRQQVSPPTPFFAESLIESVCKLAEGLGRCNQTSLVLCEFSDPVLEHEDV